LALRDVYALLSSSHYQTKQDFIDALQQHLESSVKNSNAFDEKRYSDARGNYINFHCQESRNGLTIQPVN
jgi:hypothetical protein